MRRLSITARLTLTTALLTLIVFAGSGFALYSLLAAGVRADAARQAEAEVQQLAFNAIHKWEGLVDHGGEQQLGMIRMRAPHWALVRGSGNMLRAQGLFEESAELAALGESQLRRIDDRAWRIASTPLFAAAAAGFEDLPEQVQQAVREESTTGQFLRAKLEVQRRGRVIVEVTLLESNHLLDLEVSHGGEVLERETTPLLPELPPDMRASLADGAGAGGGDELRVASWHAFGGQLVAVLDPGEPREDVTPIAVSRLGERFEVAADGTLRGPTPESRLWVVSAAEAAGEIAATARVFWVLALGFPLLWLLVILVGWYVTRQAMSPVQRIVEELQEIGVARLGARLPVRDVEDELDRISATINGMLDRIQSGYARERQFTADASHELRSPIAKVLADIEVALSKERTPEEYRATLERCKHYALGMRRLIESLLSLARLDAGGGAAASQRDFDLTDVAAEALKDFPAEQAGRVRFDFSGADTVVNARGVPELIGILLHNLVDNALRYSPPDAPVDVRLARSNGHVRVTVDDQGGGIPEEQLGRVFDRFFRLDRARTREQGGFGLGLAIADAIARVHGTTLSLANRAERGLRAEFTLTLSS